MRFPKSPLALTGSWLALAALADPAAAGSIGHFGADAGPASRDAFLSDGGSVRDESYVLTPFGPLRAGVSRIGDDPNFLADGGSVQVVPPFFDAPYGWRPHGLAGGSADFRRSAGSITTYGGQPSGSSYYRGTGSGEASGAGVVIVNGTLPGAAASNEGYGGGPKIIRVAAARLDRQPVEAGGIRTLQVGATRIIRIAPDYALGDADDRAEGPVASESPVERAPEARAASAAPAEPETKLAAVAPPEYPEVFFPDPGEPNAPATLPRFVPLPTPAPRRAAALPAERVSPEGEDGRTDLVPGGAPAEEPNDLPATPATSVTPETSAAPETTAAPEASPLPEESAQKPGFEPWTADWLRDCVARYSTFDATLGTYTDEAGRRRFCTGE